MKKYCLRLLFQRPQSKFKGVLEHYLDFADGRTKLQRWGVENAQKSSLKLEPPSQHWCWEALWSRSWLGGVKWRLTMAQDGIPLPLNPSRDCRHSRSALPPSRDVEWKAVDLACVCSPSG